MDQQHSLYLAVVVHSERLLFIHILMLSSHLSTLWCYLPTCPPFDVICPLVHLLMLSAHLSTFWCYLPTCIVVHKKETHIDQYLLTQSNHCMKTKIGIVKSMVDRDKSLCKTELGLNEDLKRIDTSFRKNGYFKNLIKKATRDKQEKKMLRLLLFTVEVCLKHYKEYVINFITDW